MNGRSFVNMMNISHYLPTGYHSVNPYILVSSVKDYFTFLENVFGAVTLKNIENPHEIYLEAKIGDSILMIQEQRGDVQSERVSLWIYVKDVNQIYEMAIRNGCTSIASPTLEFETDIVAKIIDPFGVRWFLASYKSS